MADQMATRKLHEYEESAECPKCGNRNNNSTDICSCRFHPEGFEHLARKCSRCGWGWDQGPRNLTADQAQHETEENRHREFDRQVGQFDKEYGLSKDSGGGSGGGSTE